MGKDNPDLSGISDDDLVQELKRRGSYPLTRLGKRKNNDWYFMLGEMEHDGGGQEFWLVHKRYWHLNHYVDDRHISHLITVPEGFREVSDSSFEYGGETEEGVKLLNEHGFTRLNSPLMGFDSMVIYFPFKGKGNPRVEIVCDTKDLIGLVKDFSKDLDRRIQEKVFNWKMDNYISVTQKFAKSQGLHFEMIRDYGQPSGKWQGGQFSLMDNRIFPTLPEYPEEYI